MGRDESRSEVLSIFPDTVLKLRLTLCSQRLSTYSQSNLLLKLSKEVSPEELSC